jgi:hypothetical protein
MKHAAAVPFVKSWCLNLDRIAQSQRPHFERCLKGIAAGEF